MKRFFRNYTGTALLTLAFCIPSTLISQTGTGSGSGGGGTSGGVGGSGGGGSSTGGGSSAGGRTGGSTSSQQSGTTSGQTRNGTSGANAQRSTGAAPGTGTQPQAGSAAAPAASQQGINQAPSLQQPGRANTGTPGTIPNPSVLPPGQPQNPAAVPPSSVNQGQGQRAGTVPNAGTSTGTGAATGTNSATGAANSQSTSTNANPGTSGSPAANTSASGTNPPANTTGTPAGSTGATGVITDTFPNGFSGSTTANTNSSGNNNNNSGSSATGASTTANSASNVPGSTPNDTFAIGTPSFTDSGALTVKGVRSTSSFVVTPQTVFMDSHGQMVTRDRFDMSTPATVYYSQTSDGMVALKVVSQGTGPRGNDQSSAPTMSSGTLTEVSPGVLVLNLPGASPTPVRYVNDKTTNYVDENGEPVSPDSVTPGTPVRVFYTKVGDTLVASRVEVANRGESGLPKPRVEEESSQTTNK